MIEARPLTEWSEDDGPVPENIRQFYSPPYRWSRIIGIERLEDDWISSWRCPDCGHEWPR